MQPHEPAGTKRDRSWVFPVMLVGLALLCYWPALSGGVLWDDPAHLTRLELRSWAGLGRIWWDLHATQQYYPMLHSAFWLEHRLWGDWLPGYHLVNVLLHAGGAWLLAIVLRRCWSRTRGEETKDARKIHSVPAGTEWLAAALFVAHPVAVESVAWISEQKNTLSLVFYLLAGLTYLDFAERRRPVVYALAFGFFILALGTKSVTATLPAALLVVLWWKNGRLSWRRDVVPLVPWFIVAVAAGLFTAWIERTMIGAEGAAFDLSFGQRVLLAGRVLWFYLGSLVWPGNLAFFYRRWDVPVESGGWFLYLVAALALTIALWLLRGRTRGLLAGWLLFVGTLFPALGFFNVYPFIFSYVADHFQYLAGIGFIATVAGASGVALAGAPRWLRRSGCVLAVAIVCGLAWRSNRQSRDYRDNETLARATLARTPDSWIAHHLLAVALAKDSPSRRAEAIVEYRAALRLNPAYPDACVGLAVELARSPEGRPEAIALYERALRLRPRYAEAHNNLAVELGNLPGRTKEELAHYEEALRVKPDFAEAHANFAKALAKIPGRMPEALAHYGEALRAKPGSADLHYNLANALAGTPGRMSDAIAQYETALKLDPDLTGAHANLAFQLAQVPGREADALAHAEAAVRLAPASAEAHNALAIVCVRQNRLTQAREHWTIALRLNPGYETARKNLRLLDEMTGR